jgi:hypothetical protein
MNNQPKHDDYADELDVYQTAWVIGKQRGIEMPLKADQLILLLEAGRIPWVVLNDDEKNALNGNEELNERVKELQNSVNNKNNKSNQSKNTPLERIKFVRVIIDNLLDAIESDFSFGFSKNFWIDMTNEEKMAVKEELFHFKYGSYPDYFATKLLTETIN